MSPGSHPAQHADWIRLVKAVHGAINRVSKDTVAEAAKALLRLNIFRARGVLCKTLLRAQLGSPSLAPVLASLVAVLNTRVPPVVALLVARLVAQLRDAYSAQDRSLCFATAKFMACLYNHQVVTELLVLQFLYTCLLDPTDGSIELAVGTLNECAPFLAERSPKACDGVFQRLREVRHDGEVSTRAQVMIEKLMAMRKHNFAGQETLDPRLDLVEDGDVITHFASLDDDDQPDLQMVCNAFHFDDDYLENEQVYDGITKDILGAEYDPSSIRTSDDNDHVMMDKERDEQEKLQRNGVEKTKDMTESDLVDFRRDVYLVIGSGLTAEEWAHKIVRLMRDHPAKHLELCKMVTECCSQEKTFIRTYGLLGDILCSLNKKYVSCFEETFATHYATIHRFDTRKIRNMANFYAFLLASDALPWSVLQVIRLVDAETTSSSRIFLQTLFQEMSYTLSAARMAVLFRSPQRSPSLTGIFPKDNVENAGYAVNFFAVIGLGFLTEDLREWLKSPPKDGGLAGKGGDAGNAGNDSDTCSTLSSGSTSSSDLSSDSGEENEGEERQRGGTSASAPLNEGTSQPPDERFSRARRTDYEEHNPHEGARNTTSRRDNTSLEATREDGDSYRIRRRSSDESEDLSPRRTSRSLRKERGRTTGRRRRDGEYDYEDGDSYYDSRRHRQRREKKRRRVDQRSYSRPSSPPRSRSPSRYSYHRLPEGRASSEPRY